MKDEEMRNILDKIADSQLIMAEAVKNINHNTTTLAECSAKLTEVLIQHNTQTTQEHQSFKDLMDKYWKLIIVLVAIIASFIGIKELVLPSI